MVNKRKEKERNKEGTRKETRKQRRGWQRHVTERERERERERGLCFSQLQRNNSNYFSRYLLVSYPLSSPLLSFLLSAIHPSFLCFSTVTERDGRTYCDFFYWLVEWLIRVRYASFSFNFLLFNPNQNKNNNLLSFLLCFFFFWLMNE